MLSRYVAAAMLAAVLVTSALPAAAQKAKDTVRFPLTEAQVALGNYFTVQREGNFMAGDVYERLIAFDADNHRFLPQLAASFSTLAPGVYEFELRQGVKFHNGDEFGADDVVNLLNFLADDANPQSAKVRDRIKYAWVKGAEKLSPNKIKVIAKSPSPTDLLRLALLFPIYDWKVMSSLGTYAEYEKSAVGTGPYRVVEIDADKGITLTKNANFMAAPGRRAARIANVRAMFMPDAQTQLANLLAGQIDFMRDATTDQIDQLTRTGRFTASGVDEYLLLYMEMDSAGRSENAALKDPRVRRALEMAIDRPALRSLIPGGAQAHILDSMYIPQMLACDVPVSAPPAYDPAKAKALLAEAGYPNGIDMELTSVTQSQPIATAIAGFWLKIGVRAKINNLPISTLQKVRAEGKLQAFAFVRPYAALPDASYVPENYFYNTDRDYWRDETMNELGRAGLAEFDLDKRRAIYKRMFDRINDQSYMLPISTVPSVFLHENGVTVHPKSLDVRALIGDIGWK